jgi:hypothetical protein
MAELLTPICPRDGAGANNLGRSGRGANRRELATPCDSLGAVVNNPSEEHKNGHSSAINPLGWWLRMTFGKRITFVAAEFRLHGIKDFRRLIGWIHQHSARFLCSPLGP